MTAAPGKTFVDQVQWDFQRMLEPAQWVELDAALNLHVH